MRRKNRWWIKTINDVPPERKLKLKAQIEPVGKTWCSREFIRIMESSAENKRLSKGLLCARKREACRLIIEPGRIKIGISCSGYTIRDVDFVVSQLKDAEWVNLVRIIAADTALSGALISGELSETFVRILQDHKFYFIPSISTGFYAYCSCGDVNNSCIHVIAACYFIAEALDENPWLLFYIRGKSREEIIQAVKKIRPGSDLPKISVPQTVQSGFLSSGITIPKTENPVGFFTFEGDGPVEPVQCNGQEVIPISLLGKAPYSYGQKNLADIISGLYPRIVSYANSVCNSDERK
ncbi:hypothetical protein ACKUB1_12570 [Methanospirillum stamsii]|uniref:SWIM-type domain-containing protein n=1 Tax=Methanospirillum stamsii TaxID=1277351 RepID=A0A2V2NCL6_9EURY|nr:hypothetical protein [Methanospirillum stamsii]PWR76335.1 hypothetical protein DLD82_00565 [Methanospirillum stamsii]